MKSIAIFTNVVNGALTDPRVSTKLEYFIGRLVERFPRPSMSTYHVSKTRKYITYINKM